MGSQPEGLSPWGPIIGIEKLLRNKLSSADQNTFFAITGFNLSSNRHIINRINLKKFGVGVVVRKRLASQLMQLDCYIFVAQILTKKKNRNSFPDKVN